MNKAIEVFKQVLSDSLSEVDPVKRVTLAMKEMDKEIIKSFNIEMRVNCILGMMHKSEYKNLELINLELINELLTANIGPYDYNIIPEIKSIEDVYELRDSIFNTMLLDGCFRKCHCKNCDEDFYLSFGEVEFFRKKGYALPTHCKYCKKGISKPVKQEKKTAVVEEVIPSAMEIALKKAGF